MRPIIHPSRRPIVLQQFSHISGMRNASDTPETQISPLQPPRCAALCQESWTQGRLRVVSPTLPPGIVVDRYEVQDLRDYDISTQFGEKKHVVHVWTTLRDRLIDRWLDAERILQTACVVLLSPTDELRPRVWSLIALQTC